jgi:hypothetical protein
VLARRDPQRAAQQVGQAQQRLLGQAGVFVHELGGGVQAVEEEVRVDLHLQRGEARLGELLGETRGEQLLLARAPRRLDADAGGEDEGVGEQVQVEEVAQLATHLADERRRLAGQRAAGVHQRLHDDQLRERERHGGGDVQGAAAQADAADERIATGERHHQRAHRAPRQPVRAVGEQRLPDRCVAAPGDDLAPGRLAREEQGEAGPEEQPEEPRAGGPARSGHDAANLREGTAEGNVATTSRVADPAARPVRAPPSLACATARATGRTALSVMLTVLVVSRRPRSACRRSGPRLRPAPGPGPASPLHERRLFVIRILRLVALGCAAALLALPGLAADQADKKKGAVAAKSEADPKEALYAGLALRSIGPAVTSGRIADLAVDPTDSARWIVGVASGGVWLTENAGITFEPVFDGEGSFADRRGGDRTLRSADRLGRHRREQHAARRRLRRRRLQVDRRRPELDEDGARDLRPHRQDRRRSARREHRLGGGAGARLEPGRRAWPLQDGRRRRHLEQVLAISENTGVTDVALDPRNPDVVYAAAWQRRRHVWTQVSGGPESALYKSTDGGRSFRKITRGLPAGDIGRIGLAVSPIDSDIVYAIMEAADDASGFYRSTDRGESWQKRSSHSTSSNYYTEIFADPHKLDRVYSMDVFLQVTDDGGTTFRELGDNNKHVDNHAMWIDPARRDHYVVGCDGGLYETFDAGATWRFVPNLPVTQFYKVAVDDSLPFYRVYGGTQDNFTLGGPSRTASGHGILNEDWQMLTGGDGFQPRVEPGNPDIAYALVQYGVLMRVDRRTNEETYVQPMAEPGEAPLRWNWDSAFIISPHSPTRLYFAAQRIFRSDDRGDSWRPISPDLTRQLDRNQLPVMGKIQRAEAINKHGSTSPYGNITALAESALVEGPALRRHRRRPGAGLGGRRRQLAQGRALPRRSRARLRAQARAVAPRRERRLRRLRQPQDGRLQAVRLQSADRGRTWISIAGDLPERGTSYVVIEDPVDRELLFAGTEFGLFASQSGAATGSS